MNRIAIGLICFVLVSSCAHHQKVSGDDIDPGVRSLDSQVVTYGPLDLRLDVIETTFDIADDKADRDMSIRRVEHTALAVKHDEELIALISVRKGSRTFSLLHDESARPRVSVGDLDADSLPDSIIYVTSISPDGYETRAVDLDVDGQIDMQVVWDLEADERNHTRIWFEGAWHRLVEPRRDPQTVRHVEIEGRIVPVEFKRDAGFVRANLESSGSE